MAVKDDDDKDNVKKNGVLEDVVEGEKKKINTDDDSTVAKIRESHDAQACMIAKNVYNRL